MIDLTAGIDTEEAIRQLRKLQQEAKRVTSDVVTDSDRMDMAMRRFGNTLAKLGIGFSLGNLVRQIAQTRGEFQQLEVAFTTLLQSKEKADALMSQMVELAAKTPFDLQGVASGARQLLAYGFAAEDVTDVLTRLGNVAAGLGLNLQDLTWLYGTTAVQGRLYTRDMMQFQSRGIDLAGELSAMMGKTRAEISQMVTEGKIGFPEVQKAIERMTNEGGKFYNLMQEQSKTITGLISNLGDAIDMMFNDIGKSQEGVITNVLKGTISLVENYEKVLNILLPLVAAYGMYKAALIATAAVQKAQATITATKAILEQTKMLTRATQAQILFNQAVKANPYVLAASALAGLVTLIYQFSDGGYDAAEAQKDLNESIANASAGAITEQRELARLKGELEGCTEGTKQYEAAKKKIIEKFGQYDSSLTQESLTVQTLTEKYNALNAAILKSYNARQYEQFRSEQSQHLEETMTKNFDKIYSRLIDELGDEAGAKLYAKLQDGILKGSIKQSGWLQLTGLDEEVSKALDKAAGAEGGLFDVANREIEEATINILKAQKIFEETDKKARVRFGIESEAKPKGQGGDNQQNQIVALSAEIDTARENLKKLKQELADLRAGKLPQGAEANFNWEKAIEDKKKEITEQQQKLDTLTGTDSKKTGKIAENELKKYQKEYESARKEYNDYIIDQQKKLNDEEEALERSRITNKVELIEFDRRKTIEAINEEEAAFIKLAEAYNKLAEAQGKPKVTVDTSMFMRRRNIANTVASNNTAQALQKEKEAMNAYLAEYGTYQEKRLAITETYADKIAQAQTQGERLSLQKEQEEALRTLDASMLQKTTFWTRLFQDANTMATSSINQIIEDTERLLEYIDQIKGGESADTSVLDALGLSKEQIDAVIADPEKLKTILDALKAKRDALNSRNPFGNLIQGFKDLKDAGDDADKQFKALNKILAAAQSASNLIGDLGDSMSELGEAIGSDFVSGFGNALSEISNVANSAISGAMNGFALGGPIGAGIGAGIGLLSGIISGIGKRIAYNKQVRQEYLSQLQQEYLAEFEINALYRERYEWAQKIGESTLAYLNRNSAELDKQIKANAEEQDELWAKLMGSNYVSSEEYHHGTWFKKAKIVKNYSSLQGKSWNEIELLAAQGKLSDEAMEYYEAMKAAKEEGQDLQQQLEQLAEETREAFTGIGYDSLVDSIVDGFKEGKRSAADFADDFEELMQNAVLQALKMNALEVPLRKWYEDFANAADDENGLTAEEIKQLKARYESIISSAANRLEQLEGITGVDIGNLETSQQQASSNGFQTMSQDTGNELNGRFTAIQENTTLIKNTVELMRSLNVEHLNRLTDIRDIAIQLNGNVADIRDVSVSVVRKVLPEMAANIASMDKTLKNKL